MTVRITTWIASLAAHAALGWYFVHVDPDMSAYAAGSGNDEFVVEQGVAIEGLAMFGKDLETVQAVDAEPVETSQARPEIEEVKAEEPIPESKVITSELGPDQENVPEEIEEVKDQQKQVATLEQEQELPQEQKIAASTAKLGGDATALRAYDGKLFSHIQKKIVRPRKGIRTGRVIVRFTLDPSGEVLSREVAESSGVRSIDEAALATIDKASPFPPIPVELATGPLVRTVPFRYRVQ